MSTSKTIEEVMKQMAKENKKTVAELEKARCNILYDKLTESFRKSPIPVKEVAQVPEQRVTLKLSQMMRGLVDAGLGDPKFITPEPVATSDPFCEYKREVEISSDYAATLGINEEAIRVLNSIAKYKRTCNPSMRSNTVESIKNVIDETPEKTEVPEFNTGPSRFPEGVPDPTTTKTIPRHLDADENRGDLS
jgi:hypothetical protein